MEKRLSGIKSDLIAAFDLEGTLIVPKSAAKSPRNKDDIKLWHHRVYKKLQDLKQEGYHIVIFTNQPEIGKKMSLPDFYYMIDNSLPDPEQIDIYASLKNDKNRKPMIGMFEAFMAHNGPIKEIFFVGNSAGRPGDSSRSDLLFAHNCGISFYTPEAFFLDQANDYPKIDNWIVPTPTEIPRIDGKSIIILVGSPASGKSTLSNEYLKNGAIVLSNDETGSAAKTNSLYKKALAERRNLIVIDNTNPTEDKRVNLILLAKDHGYRIVIIHCSLPIDYCKHLNKFRALTGGKLIPDIAFAVYNKRFQKPQKLEGYDAEYSYIPQLPDNVWNYCFH